MLIRPMVSSQPNAPSVPQDGGYTQLPQDVENHDQESQTLDDDPDAEFGGLQARKQLERSLLRKLDARMSILVLIYILNYIDRNNASAARLRGFEEDLRLTGRQFETLLSILYVGYILMQVPSNMFLNYIGKPSIYLPTCMILWGLMSILTGAATNFLTAFLTRFFLGFVEAAFFPGALFLLSKWYKRDELGLRTALLYCGNLVSNAFGALIASAILDGMDGTYGRAAWRWLFYIEGGVTVVTAIVAIFVLPDFPTTSTWLSPLERRLAEKRLEEDVGVSDKEQSEAGGHVAGLYMALTDWKVWWLAVTMAMVVFSLSFNAFFPTLSKTMGYDTTVTLLLCAPPWLFATVCAFYITRHSDAAQERFYHILVPLMFGMIGFAIAVLTMNTAVRYLSLFLMAQSYAGLITYYAWVSNSIPRPASKRAVALALVNAFSQLGNIVGSYNWPTSWGPSYRYSYEICILTSLAAILMSYKFRCHLDSLNKEAEREETEMGPLQKGFRYLL